MYALSTPETTPTKRNVTGIVNFFENYDTLLVIGTATSHWGNYVIELVKDMQFSFFYLGRRHPNKVISRSEKDASAHS